MPTDILYKLNRLLLITPEHAFAVPTVRRSVIAEAAAEIRRLRARIAELETGARQTEPQP